MPTYRLEPMEGFKDHSDWGASGAGPVPVWVQARDPDDARLTMELATIMEPEGYPECQLVPYRAWLNSRIVACDEDGSHAVPEGMALLGSGKTIRL